MPDNTTYLFQSERLGFRNWTISDIEKMAEINADPRVMKFFPDIQSKEQTLSFIKRMQKQFAEKEFCYFAVDKLTDHDFIGFIGLSEQTFEASFTPCIDIGWRLKRSEWNNGFATEGAKRCLEYAFDQLHLSRIYAMTPAINLKSERVMIKTGMKKTGYFKHPLLMDNKSLENCVLYEILNAKTLHQDKV